MDENTFLKRKLTKRTTIIFCVSTLLIAAMFGVVVVLRERRQTEPLPEAPMAHTLGEVRVKAVERNVETLDFSNAEAAKILSRKPRRLSTVFGTLLPETA